MSLNIGGHTMAGVSTGNPVTSSAISTTTGSGIVVLCVYNGGTSISSGPTDNASNGTPIEINSEFVGTSTRARMFYWPCIIGNAAHTFQFSTASSTSAKTIYVIELTTTSGTGVLRDIAGTTSRDTSSPWANPTPTFSTGKRDTVVCQYSYQDETATSGTVTWTEGNGFLKLDEITDATNLWDGVQGIVLLGGPALTVASVTSNLAFTGVASWLVSFKEAVQPSYSFNNCKILLRRA